MIPEHQDMHVKMTKYDRLFYNLNEELLWYCYMRIQSILTHREEYEKYRDFNN